MLQDHSSQQKKCKCGKKLSDYRSFFCRSCSKKGVNNPMYGKIGKKHPNWVGRGIMKNGYIRISIAGKERVYEHRLIMEQCLGRKLKRKEIVHHKNGDLTDNRIKNLDLITQAKHVNIHKPAKGHKCNNKRNKKGRFICE